MAITGCTDLGDGKYCYTVDHDPTAVATDAPIGSLIVVASSGKHYVKLDSGSSTNVTENLAIKSNRSSVVNPTANDDETNFYSIGSAWYNTNTGDIFICADPATGNAKWKRTITQGDVLRSFQFGRDIPVAGAGSLQLFGPGVTSAGLRVNRGGTIRGASIRVDVQDDGNSYNLEIRVNGVSVATLALPASSLSADRSDLSQAVTGGDYVTAYLVRTGGAGASAFGHSHATVEVAF